MRRPLCAFCLSALGVLALCSFLPQMGLLLPSAAIFVVFCLLVWWRGGAARGYAVCLLLGAVLGVGIMKTTGARLAKIQDAYAGRDVTLTAEVESTGRAYTAGRVSAVLMVEKVDGEAVHFRVECASLPKCEAGGRIRGRFSLDVPDATQRLDDYADGIVLSAEYLSGMLRLGQSESFRARTARLQAALSRALRKGMVENTGGVLAAMVVGDRSHLTSTLRSAYRGAGLSHVLVVSGLHVTIFCGLLDALPHKERERSRAYRRARSLLRAGTALLLVGITGATPSVLRAAVAVWVSSLGVWVGSPADTLTSLGAAGVLMCLGNGYAVYDVGFELSFAAVMGTLAGAECAGRGRERYYDRKKIRKSRREKPSRAVLLFRRFAGGVWDSLCVSLCASAATFPVLVLRGMSTTVWAVASGVTVLWLVGPMLSFGLGARSVVIAAPADVSPLLRMQGAAYATRIAEDFRDRGQHVLLIMDSLTRYAMAQREIALAIGEPPATKGYPPSVFAKLPALVERAGNGISGGGSITAFYTVLTEGDDQQDPIADSARAILDGHIVLSRRLAEAGHYPAIDIEASISRAMTALISEQHYARVRTFKQLLSSFQRNRDLVSVGAYAKGSDPMLDKAIALWPQLEGYLQQGMFERADWEASLQGLERIFPTVS